MKANPLVSVIIPAFNAERHIEACIRSVLTQTWKNIEVIVVDDGSTDNTLNILKSLENPYVRLVSQQNLGGCHARNKGFEICSGEYIQFLDADDLLSADKIELQVRALMDAQVKVAVCSTVHFFDGDDPFLQPVPDESGYLYSTSDPAGFYANLWGADGEMKMVQTSAWLVERTLIERHGKWNADILLDQDGEFFSRIIMPSNGICFTGGVNYYRKYRSGANVSGKYRQHSYLASAVKAAGLKAGYILKARNDERTRRAAANLFMQLAIDAYPSYPDLFKTAMQHVGQLHSNPVIPVLGGRTIEMIKHLFGWRIAKRISHEYHHHNA